MSTGIHEGPTPKGSRFLLRGSTSFQLPDLWILSILNPSETGRQQKTRPPFGKNCQVFTADTISKACMVRQFLGLSPKGFGTGASISFRTSTESPRSTHPLAFSLRMTLPGSCEPRDTKILPRLPVCTTLKPAPSPDPKLAPADTALGLGDAHPDFLTLVAFEERSIL